MIEFVHLICSPISVVVNSFHLLYYTRDAQISSNLLHFHRRHCVWINKKKNENDDEECSNVFATSQKLYKLYNFDELSQKAIYGVLLAPEITTLVLKIVSALTKSIEIILFHTSWPKFNQLDIFDTDTFWMFSP